MSQPLTVNQLAARLLRNGWDGHRKMDRDEAMNTPLTREQVDGILYFVRSEIGDPGMGEEDGEPKGMGHKRWCLFAMRLLKTIAMHQGQIARMQKVLADAQLELWVPPGQGSRGRGYDVPEKAKEASDN